MNDPTTKHDPEQAGCASAQEVHDVATERAGEQSATRARIDELEAALLRARAETENVRKRAAREADKSRRFAIERFARDLLPVKDSLERGLLAAARTHANDDPLREGTELTLRQLEQVFDTHGIETIEPLGERFDPTRHEAMSVTPRADVPPDTVVSVLEKGYALNDRVLRPARALVSSTARDGGRMDSL